MLFVASFDWPDVQVRCIELLREEEIKLSAVLSHVQCLEKANELKLEGNELFKASKWSEALVAYRTGLGHLPRRKRSLKHPADRELSSDDGTEEDHDEAPQHAEQEPPSEVERECAKARAVLHSNIAACLTKLDDNKGVIDASLEDDPHYIKALQRRAAASEKVDSWSSLARAQDDYKLLLELYPAGSPEMARTKRALQILEPRVQAAQKRETDEMIGKLKGLGNSVLGRFGLSTDNFKFEPNGQGGYSMNFVR
ncbi:hypothetical protein ID866_1518 [Astraeus odoratus]|nr:hypothetical protein ID866_1518 [Astraeus odoratus]